MFWPNFTFVVFLSARGLEEGGGVNRDTNYDLTWVKCYDLDRPYASIQLVSMQQFASMHTSVLLRITAFCTSNSATDEHTLPDTVFTP